MKTVAIFLSLFAFGCAEWAGRNGFFAQRYTGVGGARSIIVDPFGDLLVLGRSIGGVAIIYERDNGDGTIDVVQQRLIFGENLNLNHGVAFHNGFVYAGSATTIYRWPYTPGSRTPVTAPPEQVITGIPTGQHDSHPIVFDAEGRLLFSTGAAGNVDRNSNQARILRYNIVGLLPIPYASGEVFADGLRNEGGLAFDTTGVLHGVENGADNLRRDDLGGDIHDLNPTEELNRFDGPVGTHYGYPWCWTVYTLSGYNRGDQFAWPDFMNDGTHTDEWCRNTANNRRPIISMSAHNAPLGFDFFRGQNCGNNGAFPCDMTGDAFVSFHGSWNRQPASGYKVSRFPFSAPGQPTGEDIPIVSEDNEGACPNNCLRPVDAAFNNDGHLFVTADSNGIVVKVTYGQAAKPIRNNIDLTEY